MLSERAKPTPSTVAAVRSELRELLRDFDNGSEEAAQTLVSRYGPHILQAVRRRLHRKLRSQYDSGDFVQAVWAPFLALRTSGIPLNTPEDLVRYLSGIAKNKMVDAFRRRVQATKRTANREVPLHVLPGTSAELGGDFPG